MINQEEQWLLAEKYEGEKSDAFFAACERLRAGEPLAYLVGHCPFLDCTIYLDSYPLIPRPETEYWTKRAIEAIVASGIEAPHILDLCAGSGAIGVAVAKAVPNVHVTFAEIDPSHLPTIKKNLVENTLIYDSKKYQVLESDLFSTITDQYDFILTNPPYIDKAADTVSQNVVDHEPHLALFGGHRGLELIERIIEGARSSLAPRSGSTAQLWLEHEPAQTAAIESLAARAGLAATTYHDQYGVSRYSVLMVQ